MFLHCSNFPLQKVINLLLLVSVLVAPLALANASASELPECSQLKDLDNSINVDDLTTENANPFEPSYGWTADGSYFCGTDAPAYLRCKCGIASVCKEKMDPWGKNMGTCGCCTTWVIILFCVFIFVILVVLLGGLYACMCHGTWLYDGFPHPIMPLLPQRSATIIAPATFPLPEQAFRPYRSADFISSDDPRVIAGAIATAALEPAPELRRRRGERGAAAAAAAANTTNTASQGAASRSRPGATTPRANADLIAPSIPANNNNNNANNVNNASNDIQMTAVPAEAPRAATNVNLAQSGAARHRAMANTGSASAGGSSHPQLSLGTVSGPALPLNSHPPSDGASASDARLSGGSGGADGGANHRVGQRPANYSPTNSERTDGNDFRRVPSTNNNGNVTAAPPPREGTADDLDLELDPTL